MSPAFLIFFHSHIAAFAFSHYCPCFNFCGAQHGKHSFKITTLEAFFRAADTVIDGPKAEEEGEHELVWMIIMMMIVVVISMADLHGDRSP